MKAFYVSIIALLVLSGCSKPDTKTSDSAAHPASFFEPQSLDSTMVTGEWDWIQSTGGIYYREENPANKGYNLKIRFRSDGTVQYYKNNVLQYAGVYTLSTTTDPNTGGNIRTITQNYFGCYAEAEVEIMGLDNTTVLFEEPGADRFVHTYRRVGL